MDFKKVLIAGAVIGAVWYFYNKSKKAKVAATPKAENSNMDAALMAKMGHSNAAGGASTYTCNACGIVWSAADKAECDRWITAQKNMGACGGSLSASRTGVSR